MVNIKRDRGLRHPSDRVSINEGDQRRVRGVPLTARDSEAEREENLLRRGKETKKNTVQEPSQSFNHSSSWKGEQSREKKYGRLGGDLSQKIAHNTRKKLELIEMRN